MVQKEQTIEALSDSKKSTIYHDGVFTTQHMCEA